MKISRKAIAAVVATFALSTAGLSGTAFAEPGTGEPTPPTTVAECVGEVLEQFPDKCAELKAAENPPTPQPGDDTETDDSSSTGSSEGFFDGSSDDDGNIDPKAISSWIAVFTAIIGALSTAFVFSQRIANA